MDSDRGRDSRRFALARKLLGGALAIGLLTLGLVACSGQGTRSKPAASGPPAASGAQGGSGEYEVTPKSDYPHLKGPPLGLALTRRLLDHPRIPLPILKEHALMFAYYYGQLAGATDTDRAAVAIRRYYEAAARGETGRACSMIVPSLARALPIDYGKDGEAYLRGAKTCQAVLARMFGHRRSTLTVRPTVRGLLAHGTQGYAFIGSAKMPVSVVELQRGAGGWTIASPLGTPVSMSGAVGG